MTIVCGYVCAQKFPNSLDVQGAILSKYFGVVLRQQRAGKAAFRKRNSLKRARLHPTHIGLIERGLRNPSLDVANALCRSN